ncbi:MAG: hypothetical protein HN742_15060 [Lentisphaerae bacterium]|nr:hypothetical protein [Lentisphaerota bacterium]MBT5609582.1 hypothetical protein [Lentisphaerota bacterium]MBT7057778.1 hypothetical protein [Lentisphaerota bacterium]MBT7843197.1 hypothetical protein [Lentisphaerota bacterium]
MRRSQVTTVRNAIIALVVLLSLGRQTHGAPFPIPLKNGSFDGGVSEAGIPTGWSLYGKLTEDMQLNIVPLPKGRGQALWLQDGDIGKEIGVYQEFPVKPGETYEVRVTVRRAAGAPAPGGAYIQFNFLEPSRLLLQKGLAAKSEKEATEVVVKGQAPPGSRRARIYLYTHRGPTPSVLVEGVRVNGGLPPPPPPPPKLKQPNITVLKNLHLTTPLVADGKATCRIVDGTGDRYALTARAIQAAIQTLTGVTVPIISEKAAGAVIPLTTHLIVLGNRSTNATTNTLYDRYYTLLDLTYPGKGGHVVRSLHNPFGDGLNAILIGGSDDQGVAAAGRAFTKSLAGDKVAGRLHVGRLMDIQLNPAFRVPEKITDVETWEASAGYGSIGYFGWNSLSKRMALYYMTGNPFHARELVRLAFPDKQALKEISEIDGERIENKANPLGGAYHYNAHMATLYWDLIEESPVFSDDERLRVTNALAGQLTHKDYAREGVFRLGRAASAVGSRHGQWAAMTLYCLGRYFQKDYPDPVWAHCVQSATYAFASLHEHAWVYGESDNLFWYSTGTAPIFTYLTITGDRKPVENGVIATLLSGQDMLLSGLKDDRQLRYASLGFLNKAAYITGDGRWIRYREKTGMKTDAFRVGQSFWPEPSLKAAAPTGTTGTWSINPVPSPLWERRNSGIPLGQSFLFGSYRNETGPGGDFILLDGFNGASRNPYHTFGVLDLRLDGVTVLRGYHTQVQTSADGMVEPQVAMDAALLHRDALGKTIIAVGEVPRAAYSSWRRYVVRRTSRYALFADDVTFRTDSDNMTIGTAWETLGGVWSEAEQAVALPGEGKHTAPAGWLSFRALDAECTASPGPSDLLKRLGSINIMLLRATEKGTWLEMPFTLAKPFRGQVFADFVKYVDRGRVRILLDDKEVAADVDLNATSVAQHRADLGKGKLSAGRHTVRIEVIGSSGSTKCYVGFTGLALQPADGVVSATVRPKHLQLMPSQLMDVRGKQTINMSWTKPVSKGDHGIAFYLIARGGKAADQSVACLQTGPNAAALALPGAAAAFVGAHGEMEAAFGIAATDHVYGWQMTQVNTEGLLLSATPAVDIDWDFPTGTLEIVALAQTKVRVALASDRPLVLDGVRAEAKPAPDGLTELSLAPGRHTLTGATPAPAVHAKLVRHLENQLARAGGERQKSLAAKRAAGERRPLATLSVIGRAQAEDSVRAIARCDAAGGTSLAIAAGKDVHVLSPKGETIRVLKTEGLVRQVHWWQEHSLLLAGCADEKLIAFDQTGKRAWTYVSVMDPAVFRAAKTYWFKTAPGHEGIHGVLTGPFMDSKSQCFVGSACTLEILNPDGRLAKRLPVFWGPGWKMQLVDGPDDSRNLLIARWPNGNDTLATVNSKTLKVGRGFFGVPKGHTMVGGWAAQNRVGTTYTDLDGDGSKELVSATNGTWNRVTVYDGAGTPIHNAQFGPGKSKAPYSTMRALGVADIDGDGKQEIIAGVASGLVVGLSHTCERLWSRRLNSPPVKIACTASGTCRIAVACEDGSIIGLDAHGTPVVETSVKGRPTVLQAHQFGKGAPRLVVGTSSGQVTFLNVP